MNGIISLKLERNFQSPCQMCGYHRAPNFRISLPQNAVWFLCIVCVRSLRSLISEDNMRRALEGSLAAEPLDK